MAEDKKSFILYADLIHTVRKMPKDKQADLFMTILSYVNDENPVVEDVMVDLVFEPIKRQMKRDLKKYEGVKVTKSVSGAIGNLKRWHYDLYIQVIDEKITADAAIAIAKDRKVSQTVANVAVNDTVTVNDTDKEKGFSLPQNGTDLVCTIEHCLTIALNDNRWVKVNNATRTDLEAFNAVLEKRGIYHKNPADYKTHYHNWRKGDGKITLEKAVNNQKSAPPLRRAHEVNP